MDAGRWAVYAAAMIGLAWAANASEPASEGVAAGEELMTADLAAGEELYQSVCRNCHGPTAKGMASFPKLAGNDAEYLTIQLEEYRAGTMLGPNTALMAPHAKDLSDEEIANLAAYIATEFD